MQKDATACRFPISLSPVPFPKGLPHPSALHLSEAMETPICNDWLTFAPKANMPGRMAKLFTNFCSSASTRRIKAKVKGGGCD
jgi:hypothetical protein